MYLLLENYWLFNTVFIITLGVYVFNFYWPKLQLNLIQDFIILFAYLVIYEYANLLVVFG